MRYVTRLIAASALSFPVLLGAAGLASADTEDVSYENQTSVATEYGAGSSGVWSGAGDDYTYFFEQDLWAGEDGAWNSETGALTGEWGTYFWESDQYSGEEGAYQESTESSVEEDYDYDDYEADEDADAEDD